MVAKNREKGNQLSFETIQELENTLRTTLKDLRRYKGGNVIFSINPAYVLDIELAALKYFLSKEDLDGVVLTLSRPHYFIHRALKREIDIHPMLIYVDPVSSISGSLMGTPTIKNKVITLDGPFDIDRVTAAVEKAINHSAKSFEGDEHFIYVDNLLALAPYMDTKDILKLAKKIMKGYSGSFVYKFVGLGKLDNDLYRKVFNKIKGHSDIILMMSD